MAKMIELKTTRYLSMTGAVMIAGSGEEVYHDATSILQSDEEELLEWLLEDDSHIKELNAIKHTLADIDATIPKLVAKALDIHLRLVIGMGMANPSYKEREEEIDRLSKIWEMSMTLAEYGHRN